jgi:hypothetical protein
MTRTARSSLAANSYSVKRAATKVGVCSECGGHASSASGVASSSGTSASAASCPPSKPASPRPMPPVFNARWREQQRVRDWTTAWEQSVPPAQLFGKIEPYDVARFAGLDARSRG